MKDTKQNGVYTTVYDEEKKMWIMTRVAEVPAYTTSCSVVIQPNKVGIFPDVDVYLTEAGLQLKPVKNETQK